jgi:ComF family protein
MLENIKKILLDILDFILPPRTDYEIVRKLDDNQIMLLPKSAKVEGLDWINPIFQYKDRKVKAIVWELKYRENTKSLTVIGKIIHDEMLSIMSDIILFNPNAEFLLIPIPMTDRAKAERGYNQSELLAKAIIESDSQRTLIYAPQWFRKVKETPKQSQSESKQERMSNLTGCFEANPNVEGKYVFLIDDVVTTGSTLKEARKTILDSGAMDVYAFTIAH